MTIDAPAVAIDKILRRHYPHQWPESIVRDELKERAVHILNALPPDTKIENFAVKRIRQIGSHGTIDPLHKRGLYPQLAFGFDAVFKSGHCERFMQALVEYDPSTNGYGDYHVSDPKPVSPEGSQ